MCIIDPAPLAHWPNNYGEHSEMSPVCFLHIQTELQDLEKCMVCVFVSTCLQLVHLMLLMSQL